MKENSLLSRSIFNDRGAACRTSNPGMEMNMENSTFKPAAMRLVDQLSEDATWDDLIYEIYVRKAVESGMEDSLQGRTMSNEDVRKQFGLPT